VAIQVNFRPAVSFDFYDLRLFFFLYL